MKLNENFNENENNQEKRLWPLFEFSEKEEGGPYKVESILGFVEHLNGDFYKLYDTEGKEVTIIDRKGIIIQAIQKESERLMEDFWKGLACD